MKLFFAGCLVLMGTVSPAQQVPQSQAQITLSFAPVVREAAPAVVNIYARVLRAARRNPFQGDPFFERFFEGFTEERPRVQNSLGSGVVLSADGIVVTNYHVVGDATGIRVALPDRREFEADLLLADAASDLAILKLKNARGLAHLAFRPSDEVEVGELVLAIGNPFGVGQTVSSGIISGLARSGAVSGNDRGYFIQTDAPINPGNSGGALVDMSGRLVGINTSILTRSGGSNGIGFAIPADLVAAFVAQAEAGKRVFEKPWLGILGQPVGPDMAESFGLDKPEGVVISGLHVQSPFYLTGLQVGDVVVSMQGEPVHSMPEMIYRATVAGLGQVVPVEFLRNGELMRSEVALDPAPDEPPRAMRRLARDEVLAGLQVARVNPAVIAEFNLPLDAQGLMVVDPEWLGRRVGLQARDVILAVNDQPVAHPDDLVSVLAEPAQSFALTIRRGTQRLVLRFRV